MMLRLARRPACITHGGMGTRSLEEADDTSEYALSFVIACLAACLYEHHPSSNRNAMSINILC